MRKIPTLVKKSALDKGLPSGKTQVGQDATKVVRSPKVIKLGKKG